MNNQLEEDYSEKEITLDDDLSVSFIYNSVNILYNYMAINNVSLKNKFWKHFKTIFFGNRGLKLNICCGLPVFFCIQPHDNWFLHSKIYYSDWIYLFSLLPDHTTLKDMTSSNVVTK